MIAPSSSARRAWDRRMWPSSTVSRVPRTFTNPSTASATPGMRVAGRRGRISRTIPAGAAQISAPMRKMTAWGVGELAISIEEKKIPKGVRASNQIFASYDMQCTAQIGGPFSLEFEGRAGGGVAECQSGRVKRLTRRRSLQRLSFPARRSGHPAAPAAGVDRVANHRVAGMLEMHPDLMGPAGVELQPKEINRGEPGRHVGVGSGRPARRLDRHPLAVPGVPGQGGLDHRGTSVQVAPCEGRIGAPHPARGDRGTQPAMGQVGLGDDHKTRGVAVQSVHDAGAPGDAPAQLGPAGNQRIHQGVVPMPGRGMDHKAGRLVQHGEVLVFEDDGEGNVRGTELPDRLTLLRFDLDDVAALERVAGASAAAVHPHGARSDEAGRIGAGQTELVGEKAVEPLGCGREDGEGDGELDGQPRLAHSASFPWSTGAAGGSGWQTSSRHMETTRAMAPQLTAMSATLNVGQRSPPIPTSRKSPPPRMLRIRSIRLPAAPPATRPRASWRNQSPGGLVRDIRRSTTTATIATVRKIQREYGPRCSPKAAPWLYTRRSWNQSPSTAMPGVRSRTASATILVIRSSRITTTAAIQKIRCSGPGAAGSAALSIFLFLLAGDAQTRMWQRVEALEVDLLAALVAVSELLRTAIEAAQRFVHVPEVAPLLRSEKKLLFPLHGVGALIGHVERVRRKIAVGGLQGRVEGLVVVPELLHHPGPLLQQSLLEMGQLLLVHSPFLGRGPAPFRPSGCRCTPTTTSCPSM